MEPGSGSPPPPLTAIQGDYAAQAGLHETGLEKVLEATGAPPSLLTKISASGTPWRLTEMKPTPFSRKANPPRIIVETTCSLSRL